MNAGIREQYESGYNWIHIPVAYRQANSKLHFLAA